MATPKTVSRREVEGGHEQLPPRRSVFRAVLFPLLAVAVAVVLTLGAVEGVFRVRGDHSIGDAYSDLYSYLTADSVLGWAYRPGAGEFVGPYPFPIAVRSNFRINTLGLRGPELTQVVPGGVRVLVLGDSVASGLEVGDDETYSAVAAALLSKRLGVQVQVINAGVRGYGTDQEWLFYRSRLEGLHPDVVVVHTTANDPDDNIMLHGMRQKFGKPAFVLLPGNALQLTGEPVPDYPRCSQYMPVDGVPQRVDGVWARFRCWLTTTLINYSACFSAFSQHMWIRDRSMAHAFWGLNGGPASETEEYAEHLTSVLISRMADEVRRDGARFVLMGRDEDLQKLDFAGFERAGIPLVRIGSAFGPDTQIPNDAMHPNSLGHRQIGELLANHIEALLREVLQEKRASQ